jgi:hypothetical protein
MEIDDLRRAFYPQVKDLKRRGQTAWLCGASDGRGKVCGRTLNIRTLVVTDDNDVIMMCSKHRGVYCEGAEFVAATNGGRPIYFQSAPRP